MNGPEHFHEAELLIADARLSPAQHDESNPAAALLLAEAQVHATLALAAATALRGEIPRSDGFAEYTAWQSATSTDRSDS